MIQRNARAMMLMIVVVVLGFLDVAVADDAAAFVSELEALDQLDSEQLSQPRRIRQRQVVASATEEKHHESSVRTLVSDTAGSLLSFASDLFSSRTQNSNVANAVESEPQRADEEGGQKRQQVAEDQPQQVEEEEGQPQQVEEEEEEGQPQRVEEDTSRSRIRDPIESLIELRPPSFSVAAPPQREYEQVSRLRPRPSAPQHEMEGGARLRAGDLFT